MSEDTSGRKSDRPVVSTSADQAFDAIVEIEVDQLVVERGTFPVDEVFLELKDGAANRDVTDIDALINARPQPVEIAAESGYLLYRIGDAVSSRSVHAALLDAFQISVAL